MDTPGPSQRLECIFVKADGMTHKALKHELIKQVQTASGAQLYCDCSGAMEDKGFYTIRALSNMLTNTVNHTHRSQLGTHTKRTLPLLQDAD